MRGTANDTQVDLLITASPDGAGGHVTAVQPRTGRWGSSKEAAGLPTNKGPSLALYWDSIDVLRANWSSCDEEMLRGVLTLSQHAPVGHEALMARLQTQKLSFRSTDATAPCLFDVRGYLICRCSLGEVLVRKEPFVELLGPQARDGFDA